MGKSLFEVGYDMDTSWELILIYSSYMRSSDVSELHGSAELVKQDLW